MGKNLTKKGTLVYRDQKVAFMGLSMDAESFQRMEGFTALNPSKDAETEERKYVDERSKRTLVLSMASALDFEFDEYTGNEVLEDLVDIIELERIGRDATRPIIIVDKTKPMDDGFRAIKRDYSVQPDTSGDHEYLMNHGGEFNSAGDLITGVASSKDDWDTCTFVSKDFEKPGETE